jgi:hypothetical protein
MNLQSISESQASPEIPLNENFETLDFLSVYGKNPDTTTGLTWGYYGGRWGDFDITAGTLTLTGEGSPTPTNYIVVNRSTGAISVSTAITNWNDTASYARVYKVRTNASAVLSNGIDDYRAGPYGVIAGPPGATGATGASGDGGAGGVDSGTAFPIGSPSPVDRALFYRTDRDILYFYDSANSRWLSVQRHLIQVPTNPTAAANFSASTVSIFQGSAPFVPSSTDFYVEKYIQAFHVTTTNDGTKYWNMLLRKVDSAGSATTIGTISSISLAADTFHCLEVTVNALWGTTHGLVNIDVVKVSTPGVLTIYAPHYIGRLVG